MAGTCQNLPGRYTLANRVGFQPKSGLGNETLAGKSPNCYTRDNLDVRSQTAT